MGEVAAGAFLPFRQHLLSSSLSPGRKERVGRRWQVVAMSANSQQRRRPSTFSSSISTNLPLLEPPGVSFDEYISNRPRVFEAMFPDKRRSQRLNDDEWRIQMLPLDFLFLSVRPVIDMRLRCKTKGKDYPPGVPLHVKKVLELQATRWVLGGLEDFLKPSHFSLRVQGALYSERQGIRSRLRGQLEMGISCILPPALSLIPEDVLRSVIELVLRRLVESMKQKVNASLLSDFRAYGKESLKIRGEKMAIQSPPIIT